MATGPGSLTAEERERLLLQYRKQVKCDTRFVRMTGIPLPKRPDGGRISMEIPLDQVYIHLRLFPEERRQKEEEAERRALEERPAKEPAETLRVLGEYFYRRAEVDKTEEPNAPVDPEAALREHGRLVILAAPGAGKTTLLRWLARRAAADPVGPVPIWVALRDYATALAVQTTLGLQEFALKRVAGTDERLREALESAIRDGRALWLLDALDEAREFRVRAADEASKLTGKLVLSSRPVGYVGVDSSRCPHFQVLPLSSGNTEQFLNNWFDILAAHRGEGAGWVATRVSEVKGQLASRERLEALMRNPLLLTFVAVLASVPGQDLPEHRVGLYQKFVEELLDSWEAQRRDGGAPALKLGTLEGQAARHAAVEVFYHLGWYLHLAYHGGKGAPQPTQAELGRKLGDKLAKRWKLSDGEAETTARTAMEFWMEAGALECWQLEGAEYLAFRHLTFQEYAAAQGLAQRWKEDERRVWGFLRPRLHHFAWREPILLMAGLIDDATPFARRIARARSPYEREVHRDLGLAADLASDSGKVSDAFCARLARLALRRWRGLKRSTRFNVRRIYWAVGWARLAQLPRSYVRSFVMYALFLTGLALVWWVLPWWGALVATIFGTIAWLGALVGGLQALRYVSRRLQGQPVLETARQTLSKALGQLGAPAVPLLTKAFSQSDIEVRKFAVEALGRTGNPLTVEPLIQALNDTDYDVRGLAVGALGRTSDARAARPLVRTLGQVRKERYAPQEVANALVHLGAPAVEPLLELLSGPDQFVRGLAIEPLGRISDPRAVDPLIVLLGDDIGCSEAARALGRIGNARAVEPLVKMLGDSSAIVRSEAARALRWIGSARAVEPLVRGLRDGFSRVRQEAAWGLGRIGDAGTVDALVGALDDADWNVREAAAWGLGRIGDDRAVNRLLNALVDEDWRVRGAAAWALRQIGDPQVAQRLIRALDDADPNTRWQAAAALGWIGDENAIEPLIRTLGDADPVVRWRSAAALGWIGDRRVVEPLLKMFGDENVQVRRRVTEALGRIGDARAVQTLIATLGDGEWEVRRWAVRALGWIGDAQAVEPLVALLDDAEANVRDEAIVALGRIGDARAVAPLVATVGVGITLSEQAPQTIEALGLIGGAEAIGRLIEFLDRPSPGSGVIALNVLKSPKTRLPTPALARRAARSLWNRVAHTPQSANETYDALQAVLAKLTDLEVAELPAEDILAPAKPSRWQHWAGYAAAAAALLALWAAGVLSNFLPDMVAGAGVKLPVAVGWVALVAAVSLALFAGGTWLSGRKGKGE